MAHLVIFSKHAKYLVWVWIILPIHFIINANCFSLHLRLCFCCQWGLAYRIHLIQEDSGVATPPGGLSVLLLFCMIYGYIF